MDRREALAKAAVLASNSAGALLDRDRASAFIWALKDADPFGQAIRLEPRTEDTGIIDKASTAARIIRGAPENSDDGYRAGAAFATVPYTAVKVRLPWEVSEDFYHGNIAREGFEDQMTAQMTEQFGLDLTDLDLNGDTADVGADAAFLNIDNGILKTLAAGGSGAVRINAALVDAGAPRKAIFFDALGAMPVKYRNSGRLRWICNPAVPLAYTEYLTDRATAAGDSALGNLAAGPLGIPWLQVPQMPANRMLLADPRNFVRVVTWDIRRRRVTGETDADLAARDKRFYIFFMKRDIIIEEAASVVDVYGLVA